MRGCLPDRVRHGACGLVLSEGMCSASIGDQDGFHLAMDEVRLVSIRRDVSAVISAPTSVISARSSTACRLKRAFWCLLRGSVLSSKPPSTAAASERADHEGGHPRMPVGDAGASCVWKGQQDCVILSGFGAATFGLDPWARDALRSPQNGPDEAGDCPRRCARRHLQMPIPAPPTHRIAVLFAQW